MRSVQDTPAFEAGFGRLEANEMARVGYTGDWSVLGIWEPVANSRGSKRVPLWSALWSGFSAFEFVECGVSEGLSSCSPL